MTIPDPGDGLGPDDLDPTGEIEVWAAGGVVRRRSDPASEILVVHRPHRQDWSLPKGKVDPGETLLVAAAREILEETGYVCDLTAPVAEVRYRDAAGRRKLVVYFEAVVVSGSFEPNSEVDEIRWCPPAEAAALMTYPHDRQLVLRQNGL